MPAFAAVAHPQHVPFNTLDRQLAGLREDIEQAISRVLTSGYFIQGSEHAAFEREFADFCGAPHAIAVANGTDAIELCLRALGFGPDDQIVTVPNAGGYATAAIIAIGATPVYVDVDPKTLTLDADALSAVLSPEIKAVIVTHLYGFLADMKAIHATLAKHGEKIAVIEDCAQAHGATRDGRCAGTFGDIGAYSFYPTKNLGALGDGGAIVTTRQDLADKVRMLRQYGWSGKYRSVLLGGRNSRLDELQAAVLRVKLPHLTTWNARRREIVCRYAEALAGSEISILHSGLNSDYVAHLAIALHPARERIMQQLGGMGIETLVHFPIPDHRQPCLANVKWRAGELAVAENACNSVFSLPCFAEMTEAEVDMAVAALKGLQP
jgi:dTDP-4-amino-4,6-dideoxygalactose transaminase